MYKIALLLLLPLCTNAVQGGEISKLSPIAQNITPEGEGSKESPYVFTARTVCVLQAHLPPEAKDITWDTDDTTDAIPIGSSLAFPLASIQSATPTIIYVKWDTGWAKAYVISAPSQTPTPTDPPLSSKLVQLLRDALKGPEAPKDALHFAAVLEGIADEIEETPVATFGDLLDLWNDTFTKTKWPRARYLKLPLVARAAIGTHAAEDPITPEDQKIILYNLRLLASTAQEIADGGAK